MRRRVLGPFGPQLNLLLARIRWLGPSQLNRSGMELHDYLCDVTGQWVDPNLPIEECARQWNIILDERDGRCPACGRRLT